MKVGTTKLNQMVRTGMIDKVTFEQRPEISEDGGCLCIQRMSIPEGAAGAQVEGGRVARVLGKQNKSLWLVQNR